MKNFKKFLSEVTTQGATGSPAPAPNAITGGMMSPPMPGSNQTPFPQHNTLPPLPPLKGNLKDIIPGYGRDMYQYDSQTKTWKIGN